VCSSACVRVRVCVRARRSCRIWGRVVFNKLGVALIKFVHANKKVNLFVSYSHLSYCHLSYSHLSYRHLSYRHPNSDNRNTKNVVTYHTNINKVNQKYLRCLFNTSSQLEFE